MARVLLAENYARMAEMYKRTVTGLGSSVDVVSDGAELVERARSQEYDIIITDIHMPHMNGFDAIKRIREFNRRVRIYAISFESANEQPAIEYGANAFFLKENYEAFCDIFKKTKKKAA